MDKNGKYDRKYVGKQMKNIQIVFSKVREGGDKTVPQMENFMKYSSSLWKIL